MRTSGEKFSHKIIMGDLNADLSKPDDAETRALLNLIGRHSLIVRIGDTHHIRTTTTNSETHIDVILQNCAVERF